MIGSLVWVWVIKCGQLGNGVNQEFVAKYCAYSKHFNVKFVRTCTQIGMLKATFFCEIKLFSIKVSVALLEAKLAIGPKSSYPVNSKVSLFSSLSPNKESWFIICKVTCKKGRNSGTDLRDCLFESYDRITRGTRQKRDQKATTISLYFFSHVFMMLGSFLPRAGQAGSRLFKVGSQISQDNIFQIKLHRRIKRRPTLIFCIYIILKHVFACLAILC